MVSIDWFILEIVIINFSAHLFYTTNVGENSGAAIKSALVICWVFFHQYKPSLSSEIPTDSAGRTAPPAGSGADTVA